MAMNTLADTAAGSRRFTSLRQLELIIDFMESHKELALGPVQSKEARAQASRLWNECAVICNAEGTFRSPKEWTRYWNDLKARVKNKLRNIKKQGQPPNISMSSFEERVAAILRRDVVTPSQGVQQNPFSSQNVAEEPKQNSDVVKLESDPIATDIWPNPNQPESPTETLDTLIEEHPSQSPPPHSIILQPQMSQPTKNTDSRHRRTRGPYRSLLSQAESSMEQSRQILIRMEQAKMKVEAKRLKIEEKKADAMKEIAIAISKVAESITTLNSSLLLSQRRKRHRVENSSDSED